MYLYTTRSERNQPGCHDCMGGRFFPYSFLQVFGVRSVLVFSRGKISFWHLCIWRSFRWLATFFQLSKIILFPLLLCRILHPWKIQCTAGYMMDMVLLAILLLGGWGILYLQNCSSTGKRNWQQRREWIRWWQQCGAMRHHTDRPWIKCEQYIWECDRWCWWVWQRHCTIRIEWGWWCCYIGKSSTQSQFWACKQAPNVCTLEAGASHSLSSDGQRVAITSTHWLLLQWYHRCNSLETGQQKTLTLLFSQIAEAWRQDYMYRRRIGPL